MENVEAKSFAIGDKAVGTRDEGAVHGKIAGHGEFKNGIVDREFEETNAVAHHLVGEESVWVVVNVVGGGVVAQTIVGGSDKGLVFDNLFWGEIAMGGIDGIAIYVQPLA